MINITSDMITYFGLTIVFPIFILIGIKFAIFFKNYDKSIFIHILLIIAAFAGLIMLYNDVLNNGSNNHIPHIILMITITTAGTLIMFDESNRWEKTEKINLFLRFFYFKLFSISDSSIFLKSSSCSL